MSERILAIDPFVIGFICTHDTSLRKIPLFYQEHRVTTRATQVKAGKEAAVRETFASDDRMDAAQKETGAKKAPVP